MKRQTKAILVAICLIFSLSFRLAAQDDGQQIITVTTAHWNMEMKDFSMDEWKKVESEYHEKVVKQNEFIAHSNVLMHYYTPDNSEILFVQTFRNWEDVAKAVERSNELTKQAWPDEDARKAFLKKQNAYYSSMHSDEILSVLPNTKNLATAPSEPLIYYVRKMQLAFPDDGSGKEIRALSKEYFENVIQKNDNILAYYPHRHLYGSDSRDFVEVFVVKSLAELEEISDKQTPELIKAHWPDKNQRKEFFTAYNKYLESWHGDWIYTNVPELLK